MKKILISVLTIGLIVLGGYPFFEPQLTKAQESDETGVSLTVVGEININCSTTAALSPNIPGQGGGTATTTFSCIVETNDSDGYNLKIKKDQKLMISDTADQRFDDYTTSSIADFYWSTTTATNEEFGFCINSGTDTLQKYKDDGASCNTSTNVTVWRCWNPIPTTPTNETVVNRGSATSAGGEETVFGLRASAGGSNNLQGGDYNCTTTATATAN